MVTLKSYKADVRQARAYPTPKRKPSRLSPQVAKYQTQNRRKAKSR